MNERSRERGELERDVLKILWDNESELSARQIQEAFVGQVPAYTTVLTILDRLQKKGLVARSSTSPRKQRFSAALTEGEFSSKYMTEALDSATNREAALLSFAGNLSEADLKLLEKAVHSRKRGQTRS